MALFTSNKPANAGINQVSDMYDYQMDKDAADKFLDEMIKKVGLADATSARPRPLSYMERLNARLNWDNRAGQLESGKVKVLVITETKDSYAAFYLYDGNPGMMVEETPELFPSDKFITQLRLLGR